MRWYGVAGLELFASFSNVLSESWRPVWLWSHVSETFGVPDAEWTIWDTASTAASKRRWLMLSTTHAKGWLDLAVRDPPVINVQSPVLQTFPSSAGIFGCLSCSVLSYHQRPSILRDASCLCALIFPIRLSDKRITTFVRWASLAISMWAQT